MEANKVEPDAREPESIGLDSEYESLEQEIENLNEDIQGFFEKVFSCSPFFDDC